jgi:hypothetical protein
MPRPQQMTSNPTIEALIRRFAEELESTIRAEIDARLREALGRISPSAVSAAPAAVAPAAARYAPAAADGKKQRLCPVPGCRNPAAGPKYGWRCREHGATYRAKQAAKSGGKSSGSITTHASKPAPFVALPAPKAAAVIPAGVVIKKLPPGPTPNDPKRSGPPMECRCPGCLMKSRGPRYEFFCAEHYAAFNAEERKKYTDMWKSKRGVQ